MNKERGIVTFKADGAEYKLKFDFNAMCELEGLLGQGFMQVLAQLDGPNMRLSTLRAMFFVGLKNFHPDMTLEKAGDVLGSMDGEALDVINQAVESAFPTGEEGEKKPEKASQKG